MNSFFGHKLNTYCSISLIGHLNFSFVLPILLVRSDCMSFEDELKALRKGQETINTRLSRIEGFLAGTQGYQAPAYPRPMTKSECERLGGEWDPDTGKCTLEESVVVEAAPKNKEDCEKAGGVWDDDKKVCKISREALQSFRAPIVGVLPTSTPSISSDEAKANALIEKIVGKKKD